MKSLAATLLIASIQVMPATAQEWPLPLQIAEDHLRPVVVDGFLNTDEWADATSVMENEQCDVRLKRHGGNLFVGVKCPEFAMPVLDLFLDPGEAEAYQLHVSSYLAERVLEESEIVESFWRPELQLDWSANTIEWSAAIRDSLAAEEIYGREMLRRAMSPVEGFEVKIRETQFSSSSWKMRLQVSQFASDNSSRTIPSDSNSWILLDLSSPQALSGPVRLR